ncbi:MAG: hypothetical protein JRJ49_11270, partial [Deltaproteobacteria bacterium]|nr:hypothetical protein [Deltaproteobacteria bacterium]
MNKTILYLSVIFLLFISIEKAEASRPYKRDETMRDPIHRENNVTTIMDNCKFINPLYEWLSTIPVEELEKHNMSADNNFYKPYLWLEEDDTYLNAETGELIFSLPLPESDEERIECYVTTSSIVIDPGVVFTNEGNITKTEGGLNDHYFIQARPTYYGNDDGIGRHLAEIINKGKMETNTSLYFFYMVDQQEVKITNEGEIIFRRTGRNSNDALPDISTPAFYLDNTGRLTIDNTGYINLNDDDLCEADYYYGQDYNSWGACQDKRLEAKEYMLASGIQAYTMGVDIINDGNFIISNVYAGIHSSYTESHYNVEYFENYTTPEEWGELHRWNKKRPLMIHNKTGGDFNITTITAPNEYIEDFYEDIDYYTPRYKVFWGDGYLFNRTFNFERRYFNSGIAMRDNPLIFINEGNFTINSYNAGIKYDNNNSLGLEIPTYEPNEYNNFQGREYAAYCYADINNSGILNINTYSKEEKLSVLLSDGNDTFTNTGVLNLSYGIDGAGGIDAFNLGSEKIDSFDKNITNFEIINKYDSGTWNLGGEITGALAINLQ